MDLLELAQAHIESKNLRDLATTCEKTDGLTAGGRIKKPRAVCNCIKPLCLDAVSDCVGSAVTDRL